MIDKKLKPIILGIAGGSGAGKTTIAKNIIMQLGEEYVTYIPFDNYYHDWSHLAPEERDRVNFDHPASLDIDLFISDLRKLQRGEPVNSSVYDFKTHTRTGGILQSPRPVILTEGILIFAEERLRNLFDLRVFVDVDASTRFQRRLRRDISERGRSYQSVKEQWDKTVYPMHLEFVEPNKFHAHVIISGDVSTEDAVSEIISKMTTSYSRPYPFVDKRREAG